MTYKLFVQLDTLPKSLNTKLRAHWRSQRREGKGWDILVELHCSRKKPPEPLKRASITIVRHSYRMLDYDGLVGSLKPVVDAFVSVGVLQDDAWNVLGRWNVDQKFRPKKEGPLLEVLIQELPDLPNDSASRRVGSGVLSKSKKRKRSEK